MSFLQKAGFSCALFLFLPAPPQAQNTGYPPELYSRPERTNYLETSLHSDLTSFVNTLKQSSSLVHLETMGVSFRGKQMPLVVMADPPVTTPEEAQASGKLVVYIQGNIHGGEVEGKEAVLTLMREIAFGNQRRLLKNHILLFCPIFNIDGNDALGTNNRPTQEGSPALAGQRANGQGFDLNRDGIKLETIEGKALAEKVLLRWDPLLFVDLHTTNGTWHGYAITYAPGLLTAGHPGTVNYLKNNLLPWVKAKVLERAGYDIFHYGDFYEYPPKTFAGMLPTPRYLTNSMAVKNRLAILVETFAHDRFEKRIDSNIAFLVSLLEYTGSHAAEIKTLIGTTEAGVVAEINSSGGTLQRGVQYMSVDPGTKADLLAYEVKSGQRTGKRIWFPDVNFILDYKPAKLATVPRAYVFPVELTGVAAKLREHGVLVTQLSQPSSLKGEQFSVTRLNRETQIYQEHHLATLEGSFQPVTREWPANSFYVDLAQPLAYLIFYMLEPQSDDGLVTWNYFDQYLTDHGVNTQTVPFPVFKVLERGGSSVENIPASDRPGVYPNPANDRITIADLPVSINPLVIELINQSGQVIIRKQVSGNRTRETLEIPGINKGIYFIRINGTESLIKVFLGAREE